LAQLKTVRTTRELIDLWCPTNPVTGGVLVIPPLSWGFLSHTRLFFWLVSLSVSVIAAGVLCQKEAMNMDSQVVHEHGCTSGWSRDLVWGWYVSMCVHTWVGPTPHVCAHMWTHVGTCVWSYKLQTETIHPKTMDLLQKQKMIRGWWVFFTTTSNNHPTISNTSHNIQPLVGCPTRYPTNHWLDVVVQRDIQPTTGWMWLDVAFNKTQKKRKNWVFHPCNHR